ncbi:MAG: YDG domain-containing protein, partial [Lachnospiraceae bacterium]|nr:YDG domain-containing protein [Lachnospiraceae bacterium]
MLNQMRYIAGLGEVSFTTDESYETKMQDACLLMWLNGGLSHNPERPSVLSGTEYTELFKSGYSGASMSNLQYSGSGSTISSQTTRFSLTDAIVNGWMADESSTSNLSAVGHRRWCLNPKMGATAFGAVTGNTNRNGWYWDKGYSAMYAFDKSASSSATTVAWPARQMPIKYFKTNYPWSVSTTTNVNPDTVNVKLTRSSDQKVWNFSGASTSAETKSDFYVSETIYGTGECIIFIPDSIDSFVNGDSYSVEITDIDGTNGKSISYTVDFFATTPVTITPTTKTELLNVDYSDDTIDVSKLFTLDAHCGEATYTLDSTNSTGEGSISGSQLTVTKTGTFKIKVNTAAKGDYRAGFAEVTLTVNKVSIADATVTITDCDEFTYDGTTKIPNISVKMNNKEMNSSDYVIGYSNTNSLGTGKESVNAGTVTVVITASEDGNYTGTATDSPQYVIAQKQIEVTAEAKDKTYDGDKKAEVTLTIPEDQIISGDDVSVTAEGTFEDADAGADKTVTILNVQKSGIDCSNYELQIPETITASIKPKAVTITPDDESDLTVTYSEDAIALQDFFIFDSNCGTASYTILKDENTTGTGTIQDEKLTVTKTGKFHIQVDTERKQNYMAGRADVILTVNKGSLTNAEVVTDGELNFVYNGRNQTPDYKVTLNGKTIPSKEYVLSYVNDNTDEEDYATVNAGTITVAVTAAVEGNYTGTATASHQYVIRKKTANVIAKAKDKTYDGNINAEITLTIPEEQINSGDDVSVTAEGTFEDENVGENKTVTIINVKKSGADLSNYELVVPETTTANINPIAVTITPTTEDKLTFVYSDEGTINLKELFVQDENCGSASYRILQDEVTSGIGVIAEDTLTVTKAGIFHIRINTESQGNYAAGSAEVTLTVNKCSLKDAQITTEDETEFIFNGQNQSPSYKVTLNGKTIPSDEYILSYENDSTEDDRLTAVNAGTITVTVKAVLDGNYEGTADQTAVYVIKSAQIAKVEPPISQSTTSNSTSAEKVIEELPSRINITTQDGAEIEVPVTWEIIGNYNTSDGAVNTFQWKIADSGNVIFGNDVRTSGEITITNKIKTTEAP